MANAKGMTHFRNSPSTGKQSHLPPKSPFPSAPPAYADYSSSLAGSRGIPKPREVQKQHQRTSSESFLIEEQPSWLDELLNEPETPVKKGAHRRSSSDSFAYLEAANNSSNIDNKAQEEHKYKNLTSAPSWGSVDFDRFGDVQHASFFTENSFATQQHRGWDSSLRSVPYPSSHPSVREHNTCAPRKPDTTSSTAIEKHDQEEHIDELQGSSERDGSSARPPASEADTKRAKQQFAQRSRVRKLQYIAELERNVQALQATLEQSGVVSMSVSPAANFNAEGSEVLSELKFLDQQNLILNMENKALKQRLDSLAQEQLIKHWLDESNDNIHTTERHFCQAGLTMEQEMLEREIERLRMLMYQQQQQPPSLPTHHRRGSSRDLDSQFANLSLKHKEANSGREPSIAVVVSTSVFSLSGIPKCVPSIFTFEEVVLAGLTPVSWLLPDSEMMKNLTENVEYPHPPFLSLQSILSRITLQFNGACMNLTLLVPIIRLDNDTKAVMAVLRWTLGREQMQKTGKSLWRTI
ncbi:hypothetical protein ACLOJK_014004 [Asimina triloba]